MGVASQNYHECTEFLRKQVQYTVYQVQYYSTWYAAAVLVIINIVAYRGGRAGTVLQVIYIYNSTVQAYKFKEKSERI